MKKGIGQIKHPFKTSHQTRTRREFLNPIKDIYENPTASIIHLMEKSLSTIPPKSETRQKCPFPLLLFNIILEVSAGAI